MKTVIYVTELREHAMHVIKQLNEHGHDAYLVGGYVRDRLIGIPSADIDITTEATPCEVFPDAVATGLKFGTVTVFEDGHPFEVTTFRKEMAYDDHRHPSGIVFSDTLEEDLKRRDFTVNAFAMDVDGRVIDLFNGTEDLKHKIIRAIGDPDERFKEDALRIMRAFRFVAKLDFDIEPKTITAIIEDMPLLANIANERIVDELKKTFGLPFVKKALATMRACGLGRVFPALNNGLAIAADASEPCEDHLDFFALCRHANERPFAKTWRYSNRERRIINETALLLEKSLAEGFDPYDVYRNGLDTCLRVNRLRRFHQAGRDDRERLMIYDETLPIRRQKDLAFKGEDLRDLEAVEDPADIGRLLEIIERNVVLGNLENDRETIKRFVKETLREEHD